MSLRILVDTPYKDIRLAIQNYDSPEERVVTAQKGKIFVRNTKCRGVRRRFPRDVFIQKS